jgi:hypothetical protein
MNSNIRCFLARVRPVFPRNVLTVYSWTLALPERGVTFLDLPCFHEIMSEIFKI